MSLQCSRCRKRKIKCSGDPGNGQNCQNCKNANTEPGVCQFLRVGSDPGGNGWFRIADALLLQVNSGNLVCAPPPCEWIYGGSGTMGMASMMPQIGSSSGHYSSHTQGSISSSAPVPFPGMQHLTRGPPANSANNVSYAPVSSRRDPSLSYGAGQNDSSFDTFNFLPSQYSHQGQDTQAASVSYGTQEITRPWPATGASSRWTPSQASSFDQDYQPRYSSYPYVHSSSGSGSGLSDSTSLFPTMASLANSLPASILGSDRVLPNPIMAALGHSPTDHNISANPGGLGELNSYVPAQSTASRSTITWGPERIATGGIHGLTNPASASNVTLMSSASSKSSSSTVETPENPFGYIPFSQSPLPQSTNLAIDFAPIEPSGSTISLDSQVYPKPSFHTEIPNDTLSRNGNSSNSLYAYSSSVRRDSQSSHSGGNVLSGQQYTHLRQPQAQNAATSETRRESLERTAREKDSRGTHRSSIAGSSTSRRRD